MQGKSRYAFATFVLWAFTSTINAQGLNLLDVWQLSLQRDPTYAAASFQSDAIKEQLPQAKAKLLPQINANIGAQVDNQRRARTLSSKQTNTKGLWQLTLSQPIIDIASWNNLERAEYVAKTADVARTIAYQDLILRVTQAYFNVLTAQDRLRALRAEKLAIEAQLKAANQSFELGAATITDAHEAQARLDLVRADEYEAISNLQVSKDTLSSIIDQPVTNLAELPNNAILPKPQPDSLNAWVEQATQTNLNVINANLQTKIAEKQLKIHKSDHYPSLQLQAQTGSATDRGILGGRPHTGSRSLDSTVGVTLSIPLFTGGELSSKVREQSSKLQQNRAQAEAAKRMARQDAQHYFSGVKSGLERVNALSAAEQSSTAALNANEIAYEVGVRINIDVLNAQQQLYATQRQLSQTRYDTLMNSLKLKASSGTLNEDDLLTVNSLLSFAN